MLKRDIRKKEVLLLEQFRFIGDTTELGIPISTIRFVGSDYDFKLKGASASDRPDKFRTSVYFNPSTITVPQYNARIGYYFKDKMANFIWCRSHEVRIDDHNEVTLDGYIKPGIDTVWSGDYFNQPVVTDRTSFHYENTNGV